MQLAKHFPLHARLLPCLLRPTAAAATDDLELPSMHSNVLHTGAFQANAAVSAIDNKPKRSRKRLLLPPLLAPDCPLPASSNASHGVSMFPQAQVFTHNSGSKNGLQSSQKGPVRKSLFVHDGHSDADAHKGANKGESPGTQQAGSDVPALVGGHADHTHQSRKCIEPVKPGPADVPDFSSIFEFL